MVYLFLYLLPGIVAYFAINVEPVFRLELALTGLSPKYLQYAWVLIITFGWHMFVPFLVLKYADGLTLRESFPFLGLNRVDWRGLFLVLPLFAAVFALVSLPYMKVIWLAFETLLNRVPLFRFPSYSIFQDVPDNVYTFPPLALGFLFLGNFVGKNCTSEGT